MLVRLVYASRAVDGIDEALVKSVLDTSVLRNHEHGITGVLCSYPGHDAFLQVLEGARAEVNTLYANILRDRRHRDITLLRYEEIEQRRFANWRMGSVDLKKTNLSTILRYSERPGFDPFTMTGKGALALLEDLVETAAIVSRDGR
jgi:Sensors of blue-light using FAD